MRYDKFIRRLRGRIGRLRWAIKVCPYAACAAGAIALIPAAAYGDEVPTTAPTDLPTAPPAPPVVAQPMPPTSPPQLVPAPVAPVPTEQVKPVRVEDKPALIVESPAPAAHVTTDHELVVGAIGLGYIGSARAPLPLAKPNGRGDQAGMNPNDKMVLQTILIPTLGLRKWLNKRYAFEGGVGLSFSGGTKGGQYGDTSATVFKAPIFALSVHGGIPVVIADTRHMAFMLIPEATVSFAASNVAAEYEENAPPNARLFGGSVDLGLRAGAEVHFGFMGLPRLTLQAGVGLFVTAQWARASVAEQALTDTSISLGLGSAGNPWDIFSGVANMSARYYF